MPIAFDTALFYAVFIAPGFIAVMTVISLAAIEDEYSSFVLLVWSLVVSLVVDTAFLSLYQWFVAPVESFEQIPGILFDPTFQSWYVLGILLFSFVIGVVASIGILLDVPGGLRRLLQVRSNIKVNPRQPWANFMRNAGWVEIKTSDDQLYQGRVTEWSRADRPKQVWVNRPHRYHTSSAEFEPVDSEYPSEMLFLEKDVDRLVMLTRDELPSLQARVWDGLVSHGRLVREWMQRRKYTGALVLFLAAWYGFQRIVAGQIGVEAAEPWFYFMSEPATGWLFAPISHNMEDVGHLRRNLTGLLLGGSLVQTYFGPRKFLKLVTGLSVISVLVPAVINLALYDNGWLVAGASGGMYGLFAFVGVYRYPLVLDVREWPDMEEWGDLYTLAEIVGVGLALFLLVYVPVNDFYLSPGSGNPVGHLTGIVCGVLLGFYERGVRLHGVLGRLPILR